MRRLDIVNPWVEHGLDVVLSLQDSLPATMMEVKRTHFVIPTSATLGLQGSVNVI